LLVAAQPARADDAFIKGSAQADASSFGLSAKQGAASVGLNWDNSSASYRSDYAAATAKPLDLQLLRLLLGEGSRCTGDTSPVPLPDSEIPPTFDTNTLATSVGTQVQGDAKFPGLYGTPSPGVVGHGVAYADKTPSGTASVQGKNINLIVAEIVNPSTSATASLSANVRSATAVSKADRISFLWGLMTIENPTWTATIKSGAEASQSATFTVSGGTLWGQKRTAEQAMQDLKDTADFIQKLLGYVGLSLDLPQAQYTPQTNGMLAGISPLTIRLTDSPLGKDLIAPALAAPQPDGKPTLNQAIEDALDKWAAEKCDNKRYRQIAEILLGLLKGSGTVEFPIGGATVSTDATPEPTFDMDLVPPIVGVEGDSLQPPVSDDQFDTTSGDTSSYGADYTSSDATTEDTTPPATDDTSTGDGNSDVVEFAAPIASQTKTIPGVTGGAGIAIGIVMILLAAAGIVSERVLRARRVRRVGS
jgi:hypothetical protein